MLECTQGIDSQRLALSAADVAKLLNISIRHVWALNSSNQLPRPLKLGRLTRWRASDICSWLEAGAPPRDRWESIRDLA
jgi:predicted DNA-binding transcriptional regulator AlpA